MFVCYYRRFLSFLILLAGLFGVATAAFAQDYKLRSGDVLRLEIVGLPGASWTSAVNSQGFVRFPYLGKYQVNGLTLDDMVDAIVLNVVGQQISGPGSSGEVVVVLKESSLFVDIATYRPLTVYGAVAKPGRVDYSPGMSVRSSIGAVGGLAVPLATTTRPDRLYALNSRLDEFRKTEAWLMLDQWRIDGQLDPALEKVVPEDIADVLNARLEQADIDAVRIRIAEAKQETDQTYANLEDRIVLAENRIEFLEAALAQYEVVSAAEEARLATSLDLKERGLTVTNNVNSARSAALTASSRVLATEADLAEGQRELRSLIEQRDTVYSDVRLELLEARARVRRSLDEVAARIAGAERELAFSFGKALEDDTGQTQTTRLVLHRLVGTETIRIEPDLDDPVLPGDILEVEILQSSN